MVGISNIRKLTAAAVMLVLVLQVDDVFAENKLCLKKSSDNIITVELTNTDAIAGFQFSINARGGLGLRLYVGTERSGAAALETYQFLKNDSTLNVIILAPFHASLPAGEGVIGSLSYTLNSSSAEDTVLIFLSNVAICDIDAKLIAVNTPPLAWIPKGINHAQNTDFSLKQNFPNPFNPSTTIAFKVEKPVHVRLTIYDITGRLINTLIDQDEAAGLYSAVWNADDSRGAKIASGMYFSRLQAGDRIVTRKMLLTK